MAQITTPDPGIIPARLERRPVVAVVIPTHNRRERLVQTLARVLGQECATPFRVVVVCDTCTDDTIPTLRQDWPQVLRVESSQPLWWSESINRGVRAVSADFYLLLNDDVEPAPDALARLLEIAAENPGAIVGSSIYFAGSQGAPWCLGGRVDWLRGGAVMLRTASGAEVDWLPGMGTLVPRQVFERLGGLDSESFPQYFGDTDFTLRARRAGVPILCASRALLWNDVSTTGLLLPPGPQALRESLRLLTSLRSHSNLSVRWRFLRRHCPPLLIPWQLARFYLPLLAAALKKAVQAARQPRSPWETCPTETTACTMCGCGEAAELARIGPWGLQRCRRCRMAYVSPRPATEALGGLYSADYFEGRSHCGNPAGYRRNAPGYRARARVLLDWLQPLMPGAEGPWLDVGCGPGYLLAAVRDKGFEPVGIDISQDAVAWAREQMGVEAHRGAAEDLDAVLGSRRFGVVSLVDTLFHLPEPGRVLRALAERLLPGGWLLAGPFDLGAPPDFQAPAQPHRMGVPEHLSFVNQASMEYWLPQLGFRDLQFLPEPLTPAGVAARKGLPRPLVALGRSLLSWFPRARQELHRLALSQENPLAGYVLARKPVA